MTEFLRKNSGSKIPKFPQCAVHNVEKREILCHANFSPWNQFTVKFFSKTLIWRNFCEKNVAVKCCNFHSVWDYFTQCENYRTFVLLRFYVKSKLSNVNSQDLPFLHLEGLNFHLNVWITAEIDQIFIFQSSSQNDRNSEYRNV